MLLLNQNLLRALCYGFWGEKFDTSKLDKLEIVDLGQGIKLYYVQNKQNNQYDITYTYPKGYVDDNNLSMAGELFYEVGTKNIH